MRLLNQDTGKSVVLLTPEETELKDNLEQLSQNQSPI